MTFTRFLLIIAVTALVALAAGFSAASAQAASPHDAIARLTAAVAARDAEAVAALFTEDTIVQFYGSPVLNGRDAVRDSWQQSFATGFLSFAMLEHHLDTGTDRASLMAHLESRIQLGNGPVRVLRSRSLWSFRLTPDGWLISAYSGHPEPDLRYLGTP